MIKLAAAKLEYDIIKLALFYKQHIFKHEYFRDLKKFLFLKVITPLNHMIEQILMKINHKLLMFDWAYKFNNSFYI